MKKILMFAFTALVLAISLQAVSAYSYYHPEVDTYYKQTVYYPGGKTVEIVKETPWKSSYYRSSEDYDSYYPTRNKLYNYWEHGSRYSRYYQDYDYYDYGYRDDYFSYRPSRYYFHY